MRTQIRTATIYEQACDNCGKKKRGAYYLPNGWYEICIETNDDSETKQYCSKECANEATKGGLIK